MNFGANYADFDHNVSENHKLVGHRILRKTCAWCFLEKHYENRPKVNCPECVIGYLEHRQQKGFKNLVCNICNKFFYLTRGETL